ncbi:MAG: DUF1697 domain-containing protein [Bacteroidetes bacterium]|nr:DUF1697 domain-containing protein [Bacteroidota bacterium]MCW5896800.1 DUF1697 domain-containing protein [Bacteroidota bacterium]
MPTQQYVALLRGINVGGNNIIKMADLKSCFEEMGFADVLTYIQSGNVIFGSGGKNEAKLTSKIERVLSATFRYNSRVLIVPHKKFGRAVQDAPNGFGSEPAKYRYDVIFLMKPLTAKVAMESITIKEGVDCAFEGRDVLYFSRLIARASQSRLTKIISLPIYQDMTIRNWNTTTKLLVLMESRPAKRSHSDAR